MHTIFKNVDDIIMMKDGRVRTKDRSKLTNNNKFRNRDLVNKSLCKWDGKECSDGWEFKEKKYR